MEPKSYVDQETIVKQLLAIKSDLSGRQLFEIYEIMFGQRLTWSVVRRAKNSPPKSPTSKKLYVLALMTLFPMISNKLVMNKTRMYFKEEQRGDTLDDWRTEAQKNRMTDNHAREIVNQVEQGSSVPTLGLEQ